MTKATKSQHDNLLRLMHDASMKTRYYPPGPIEDFLVSMFEHLPALVEDAERCAELEDAIMEEIQMRAADPATMYGAWRAAQDRVDEMGSTLRRIGLPGKEICYCRDGHEECVLLARAALEECK